MSQAKDSAPYISDWIEEIEKELESNVSAASARFSFDFTRCANAASAGRYLSRLEQDQSPVAHTF